jgi:hypothetical protein
MNITNYAFARSLVGVGVVAVLLAGCASAPTKPPGSAEVRAKLTALQSDPATGFASAVLTALGFGDLRLGHRIRDLGEPAGSELVVESEGRGSRGNRP